MSKVTTDVSRFMFERAGVDQERFTEALITMGAKHLKTKQMREAWRKENPTRNYCYVIAQFVYCYCAPAGSTPWRVEVPDPETFDYRHYYVKWPDHVLVDLAAEQFEDYGMVLRLMSGASKATFFPPWPDTRTRMLAGLLGYTSPLRASGDRATAPTQPVLFR